MQKIIFLGNKRDNLFNVSTIEKKEKRKKKKVLKLSTKYFFVEGKKL